MDINEYQRLQQLLNIPLIKRNKVEEQGPRRFKNEHWNYITKPNNIP